MFTALFTLILFHLTACLWVIVYQNVKLFDEETPNWVDVSISSGKMIDNSTSELYSVSMYFCITTITTVGYGDISGNNSSERVFCSLLQIIGAMGFSYVTSLVSDMICQHNLNNSK